MFVSKYDQNNLALHVIKNHMKPQNFSYHNCWVVWHTQLSEANNLKARELCVGGGGIAGYGDVEALFLTISHSLPEFKHL